MSEDRMSAVDYLMHRVEANPRTRSAVLSIEVLDRAPDWDRFVETFDRASRGVARMRQKVVVPALPTTSPRWVVDPDFDLGYHVRRLRLPEPGTMRQLLDVAEQVVSSMLDLSRPLWTATLVEGLEGGRAASLAHMSHAVTDGMGAVELFSQVYDLTRDAQRGPLPPLPAPLDLSPADLAVQGIRGLPGKLVDTAAGLVGRTARALASPVGTATGAASYATSATRVLGSGRVAEPSPLLRRRGIRRRTLTLDLDLDRLRLAAKTLGGSLNDTYLAGLCAGLRLYHDSMGVPVDALPMAIPVSVRSGDDSEAGNQIAAVNLVAPVGERDPRLAVQTIREQVAQGRGEPALEVLGKVSGLLTLLPDAALETVAGAMLPADVQASNLPSYPEETYLAGAKVLAQYALGPLPGVAAMVVFVTRMGRCFVTFRYDTDSFEDKDVLERCLAAGFEEVLGVGEPASRKAPESSAKGSAHTTARKQVQP